MFAILSLIITAGLLALLYAYLVGKKVMLESPGNLRMQEIATAIQEGATSQTES